jgi:hypothetical protein
MAKKKNPKDKSTRVKKKIDNALIRKKANEIYMNRIKKGIARDADSDWIQAKNELMN